MTDISDIIIYVVLAIWLFIPALAINPMAAFFGKYAKTKMDFSRTWNGKRIFGDGKTWAGFFFGIVMGIVVGLIQLLIAYPFDPDTFWGFRGCWQNLGIIACLASGAALGDLCGAFIKRRIGMERGEKAPFLDQYDFVVGAFVLTLIFFPSFIISNYFEGWHLLGFFVLLVATYALHRGVNIIGYKTGVKKEPW